MTDSDSNGQESPGTATRRRFLGAAATLATLPATIPGTSHAEEPVARRRPLMGYVADDLVHDAYQELVYTDPDPERARLLLRQATALIDAQLVEPDDPWSVPHRSEYEVEYSEERQSP